MPLHTKSFNDIAVTALGQATEIIYRAGGPAVRGRNDDDALSRIRVGIARTILRERAAQARELGNLDVARRLEHVAENEILGADRIR